MANESSQERGKLEQLEGKVFRVDTLGINENFGGIIPNFISYLSDRGINNPIFIFKSDISGSEVSEIRGIDRIEGRHIVKVQVQYDNDNKHQCCEGIVYKSGFFNRQEELYKEYYIIQFMDIWGEIMNKDEIPGVVEEGEDEDDDDLELD